MLRRVGKRVRKSTSRLLRDSITRFRSRFSRLFRLNLWSGDKTQIAWSSLMSATALKSSRRRGLSTLGAGIGLRLEPLEDRRVLSVEVSGLALVTDTGTPGDNITNATTATFDATYHDAELPDKIDLRMGPNSFDQLIGRYTLSDPAT